MKRTLMLLLAVLLLAAFPARSAFAAGLCTEHNFGGWEKGELQHQRRCLNLGCTETEKADHNWKDVGIIEPAKCYKEGKKEVICLDCGFKKTVAVPADDYHAFSQWKDNGDGTHIRSCINDQGACGKTETQSHNWKEASVITPANCSKEGERELVCIDCDARKREPIPKNGSHTFGQWLDNTDDTHSRKCTACSHKETAGHTWDAGVITKNPDCQTDGEKTYTCTGCGAEKQGIITRIAHTYDHSCDTTCNKCGQTRTTTHKYAVKWSKNQTEHWHECTECGAKKDAAAHTPGPEATATEPQTCTACGHILKPALNHTHEWATEWTTDETGHWYACNGCEETQSFAEHTLENACDPDCEVCGYTRRIAHTYDEQWQYDEHKHWQSCTGCGLTRLEQTHTPGPCATAVKAQTCATCGYELTPALGGEPVEVDPDLLDPPKTPWGLIIIGSVVAVVVATVWIFGAKRKPMDDWG